MSEHLPISVSLAKLLQRPVSAADRSRARLHLLDWLGCAIAGVPEPGCAEVRRLSEREGAGRCRIIGGGMAGPQAAALANGPLGTILEMDDVDKRGLLHPGPVIMPAVLAIAQEEGIDDGNALLDGIVAGYEAMVRVGRAAGEHRRMFHATATTGTFGAAAAGARLLGLNEEQTSWALGNAGQQASGLWQVRHERVFTKSFHDGRAAANGVAAALLAHDGYRGPQYVFEGPEGFFPAMCPGGDPAQILTDPEAGWLIHEVSFKPHAACRHAHPTIDAVLATRAQVGGREIREIAVRTYRDALIYCKHDNPSTPGEAKFSLTHTAAVAMLHGDADLARFTLETIADPAVTALRAKVTYAEDAEIHARFPAHFAAAATIILADGTIIASRIDDALGDPENPLDQAAVEAKARSLMAWGGMDEAAASRLIAATLTLGEGTKVNDMTAALPEMVA